MRVDMAVKITFVFNDGSQSISESWYAAVTGFANVPSQDIFDYVKNRMNISGVNTRFQYCRVSTVGTFRRVQNYYPSQLPANVPQTGTYIANGNPHDAPDGSDFSGTALLVRKNEPGGSFARVFMRGVPDSIIVQGGQYLVPAGYQALFTVWAAQVVGRNWGWASRPAPPFPPQTISGAAQNADGTIRFTLAGQLFGAPFGPQLTANASIANAVANRNLNGPLIVRPIDATHCDTIRQIALGAFASVNAVMRVIVGINVVQVNSLVIERVTRRAPGRFFGGSPGRRRNRIRG
jgi:hypothetical protein